MKYVHMFLYSALFLSLTACSTINDSLQLGALTGFAAGSGATYAGYSATGASANLRDVAVGGGIGMGIGLIASYLIHRGIEEERQSNQSDQTELYFGDLPPSPFIVPKPLRKAVRK